MRPPISDDEIGILKADQGKLGKGQLRNEVCEALQLLEMRRQAQAGIYQTTACERGRLG